jgi:LPPG:FO 2-phospho-L-lactate transferase
MKVTALAGGVGGAKLAFGLSRILPPENFSVIVNTGDDLTLGGLYICPDLDTVTYNLAEINDPDHGWGRRNETWYVQKEREKAGYPAWFKLGDQDLALHLERTRLLADGLTLTEVTQYISKKLTIPFTLLPMTDSIVRTMVNTKEYGRLAFQEYFVKHQFQPQITSIEFDGIDAASITKEVSTAIVECDLIVICPSNPFVSINPILSIPGLLNLLYGKTVVAVSPIVGGAALKGPAAKMFRELGYKASSANVAKFYRDILTGFIFDNCDSSEKSEIDQWGIISMVTDILMSDNNSKIRLAREVLDFGNKLIEDIQS